MHLVDWSVIAAYGVAVLLIGWRVGRGHQTTDDFFLGGRRIPAWAAFCSMVATELSAATFIGVPQIGFTGDWYYLQYAVGSLLARVALAVFFLRAYYRLQLVTVYGLLGERFGRSSELVSAWFFLVGRLLASAVRLFIAALAFATVTGFSMEASILLAGSLALAYTLCGGIRAVIWTDTLQGAVFLVAAAATLVVAVDSLSGGVTGLVDAARAAGKTSIIDVPPLVSGTSAADVWEWLAAAWSGFVTNYLGSGRSLFVAVMGGFFLTMATHGTDQDMVQRLLTTPNAKKSARALIGSGLANFPLVIIFLGIGTALWAYYDPRIGDFDGSYDIGDAKRIFPVFVFNAMPVGLRGLIFAGLFAAAMSSMDSALNSLVTTWIVDVRRKSKTVARAMWETRAATVVFGALLIGVAMAVVPYERRVSEASVVTIDERAIDVGDDAAVLIDRDGEVVVLPLLRDESPRRLVVDHQVVAVATGDRHGLLLDSSGAIWTFGANDHGQLGLGDRTYRETPRRVEGLPRIRAIGAGRSHSLAVAVDGRLWAWGAGENGQLGLGRRNDQLRPVRVDGIEGVRKVVAGSRHTVILGWNRRLYVTGSNEHGQLGTTAVQSCDRPRPLDGLPEILDVAAAADHSIAIDRDGRILVWGGDDRGEIGLKLAGLQDRSWHPVLVPQPSAGRRIATGASMTLIERDDGSLARLAENGVTEVDVEGGVLGFACGGSGGVAIRADGTIVFIPPRGDVRSCETTLQAARPSFSLIDLALSAMTIVYGGLLGAFLVALFLPRRGTDTSIVAGMFGGAVCGVVLFLHPVFLGRTIIAWPWWIVLGTTVSLVIGASRPARPRSETK